MKDSRLCVDPKFKRVIALQSMALGFPSVKKYTEYLADKSLKENETLRKMIQANGNNETFR